VPVLASAGHMAEQAPPAALSRGNQTAEAIREAAADLFQKQGYGATSLRQVANAVGVQVGSLYNHISSKEELLATMMIDVMNDLLVVQQEAVAGKEGAMERLRAAIDVHLRFHAERARDVFIGNSELRALQPPHRQKVMDLRGRYERTMVQLVREASDEAGVPVVDARLQAYAILAIGAHLPSWYRDDGDINIDNLVSEYTALLLRQFGLAG
jgi:AcrR family transcriptional regulator